MRCFAGVLLGVALFLGPFPVRADITTGLILALAMQEGTGATNLTDASPSPISVTLCAGGQAPAWVAGPPWKTWALDFDGADDCVLVPQATKINDLTAFTVALWFRWDTAGEFGGTFANKRNASTSQNGWRVKPVANAALNFTRHSTVDSMARNSNTGAFATATWTHFMMTTDGSGTTANVHFYINNVDIASTVGYGTSDDGNGTWTTDAAQNLTLGAGPAGESALDGAMCEVYMFNRVLASGDRDQLYATTGPQERVRHRVIQSGLWRWLRGLLPTYAVLR
jgi:hypothetical protein